MKLKFWDKKARLIAAFSDLTVDEAREVVRKARPGWIIIIALQIVMEAVG